MVLANSGFHTRKNLSENYMGTHPQTFRQACPRTKNF